MTAKTREAVTTLPRAIVVTPEEYDALPPSSLIELVDGVIHTMAPPNTRHQNIVDALRYELSRCCPPRLRTLREQEIRLHDDHRRNPDIIVVAAEAVDLDANSYAPADVLLAIEVVSPNTRTADRKHKPSEYAEAGIPHYWRVEPLPQVTVYTYRLDETDAYEPTGVFTVGEMIAAPGLEWAAIHVATLEP